MYKYTLFNLITYCMKNYKFLWSHNLTTYLNLIQIVQEVISLSVWGFTAAEPFKFRITFSARMCDSKALNIYINIVYFEYFSLLNISSSKVLFHLFSAFGQGEWTYECLGVLFFEYLYLLESYLLLTPVSK